MRTGAGVTVRATVLAAVHDEIVDGVELGEAHITAHTEFHILVFYFILNNNSLLTHATLGQNVICTDGYKWFSFFFIG